MGFSRINSFTQIGDVAGSVNVYQDLDMNEENIGYGIPLINKGNNASLVSVNNTTWTAIIGGLTGMTNAALGHCITLENAAHPGNNTTLIINQIVNSSTVRINNFLNFNLIAPDVNNGNLKWQERNTYSLEDDLNYIRTDRVRIKGTEKYYHNVPPFVGPDGYSKNVNLVNISGKTTDAIAYNVDEIAYNLSVNNSLTKITYTNIGNLKIAGNNNRIGIPTFDDGYFAGNYLCCYVEIVDANTEDNFYVQSGTKTGEKIYGLTTRGSSVSPNSIEIVFYSCAIGKNIATNSSIYTWDNGNKTIHIKYGINKKLDNLNPYSLRPQLFKPKSFAGTGLTESDHGKIRQLIHLADIGGPFEGFADGAYREISGQPFPTNVTWYDDQNKVKKIVEKIIVRNSSQMATTITYKVYDINGSTVLYSVRDTITYVNNIFEASRRREVV